MLTYAVAALAMLAPANKQGGYILPLYDLVPSVDTSNNVTINFMLSAPWNGNNNSSTKFYFYFASRYYAFAPNGSWSQIFPYSWTPISGSQVTITFAANQFPGGPTGTIWVMYAGGPSESPHGQETSVTATNVWTNMGQGGGSRPGSIVPISDVARKDDLQAHNVNVNFSIDTPFSGNWGNSTPAFYDNTGPGNSQFPGNGWQMMTTGPVSATPGFTGVSTVGHPNANAGYYLVGCWEYYTPNEPYNTHNYALYEYSAIIRQFSGA